MQRNIIELPATLGPVDVTMAPGFMVKWIRTALVVSTVRGTRILTMQILNKATPPIVIFQLTADTTGTQILDLYIPSGYRLRVLDIAGVDPTHDTILTTLGVEID